MTKAKHLESLKRARDAVQREYERAKFSPVESGFLKRVICAYEEGIEAVESAIQESDRNG